MVVVVVPGTCKSLTPASPLGGDVESFYSYREGRGDYFSTTILPVEFCSKSRNPDSSGVLFTSTLCYISSTGTNQTRESQSPIKIFFVPSRSILRSGEGSRSDASVRPGVGC